MFFSLNGHHLCFGIQCCTRNEVSRTMIIDVFAFYNIKMFRCITMDIRFLYDINKGVDIKIYGLPIRKDFCQSCETYGFSEACQAESSYFRNERKHLSLQANSDFFLTRYYDESNQLSRSQMGFSREKIGDISLRVTNVDVCAKCVSRYDVCNRTLPFEERIIRAFDVGLTMINNTSYTEQTYIEYARFCCNERNKHSLQHVIDGKR